MIIFEEKKLFYFFSSLSSFAQRKVSILVASLLAFVVRSALFTTLVALLLAFVVAYRLTQSLMEKKRRKKTHLQATVLSCCAFASLMKNSLTPATDSKISFDLYPFFAQAQTMLLRSSADPSPTIFMLSSETASKSCWL